MKKTILLLSLCFVTCASFAQLTLTGASPYTQNFDGLGTGLPTGWMCYNSATAAALGTVDATFGPTTAWGAYYDTSGCPSDVFGTGFKNSASADGFSSISLTTCAMQEGASNRCLAVRQSSATSHPGYDPGASFVLHLTGTAGMTGLACNFNLQSLDPISPRTTVWTLDYATGATPTSFTPVTPTSGTMSTGGSTFANHAIVASFGSALDNKTTDVWIRISTLAATTGSGNRTTSGIDDFQLTWTGMAISSVKDVNAQTELGFVVLGNATSNKVSFLYNAQEAGNYNLVINDITGRTIHTESVNATGGDQQITVNGLNLTNGLYVATLTGAASKAVTKFNVQ